MLLWIWIESYGWATFYCMKFPRSVNSPDWKLALRGAADRDYWRQITTNFHRRKSPNVVDDNILLANFISDLHFFILILALFKTLVFLKIMFGMTILFCVTDRYRCTWRVLEYKRLLCFIGTQSKSFFWSKCKIWFVSAVFHSLSYIIYKFNRNVCNNELPSTLPTNYFFSSFFL